MIIVKLMGGLGNQMFQYAIGRYLAHKHNTELRLDLSYLNDKSFKPNETQRDYELSVFNINSGIATEKEVDKFILKSKGINKFILKIQKKISDRRIVRERFFHFDENIKIAGRESYLEGYFQTEKYFKEINEIIRTDFTFKREPPNSVKEWLEKINTVNSISIHFRRGDFLANTAAYNHHGVCTMEYYYQAIEILKGRVKEPQFFVFSDDINWVKENFKSESNFYFVENKNTPAYEDLRLMSSCKHNIIANSSFSWWGAWLNSTPEKIVTAPKKYLNEPTYNLKDVIPDTWIKI